jgi:DNA-binding NarL/FixJ family response regulator
VTGNGSHAVAFHGPATGIRVLIVSREDLTRAGLRGILAMDVRLEVVAEVDSAVEAILAGRRSPVDVVVVAHESLEAAAETVGQISSSLPGARMVALVDQVDPDGLLTVIRAGAAGVVGRDAPAETITTAIRATAEGGLAIPPDLAASVLRDVARGPSRPARRPVLTAREREVLVLIAEGRTNREIARSLAVSVGTVKAHVEHILAKLGASHRTDAAIRGLRLGLIDDGPDARDGRAEVARDGKPTPPGTGASADRPMAGRPGGAPIPGRPTDSALARPQRD